MLRPLIGAPAVALVLVAASALFLTACIGGPSYEDELARLRAITDSVASPDWQRVEREHGGAGCRLRDCIVMRSAYDVDDSGGCIDLGPYVDSLDLVDSWVARQNRYSTMLDGATMTIQCVSGTDVPLEILVGYPNE